MNPNSMDKWIDLFLPRIKSHILLTYKGYYIMFDEQISKDMLKTLLKNLLHTIYYMPSAS